MNVRRIAALYGPTYGPKYRWTFPTEEKLKIDIHSCVFVWTCRATLKNGFHDERISRITEIQDTAVLQEHVSYRRPLETTHESQMKR